MNKTVFLNTLCIKVSLRLMYLKLTSILIFNTSILYLKIITDIVFITYQVTKEPNKVGNMLSLCAHKTQKIFVPSSTNSYYIFL